MPRDSTWWVSRVLHKHVDLERRRNPMLSNKLRLDVKTGLDYAATYNSSETFVIEKEVQLMLFVVQVSLQALECLRSLHISPR
jgi:hypothetical protein